MTKTRASRAMMKFARDVGDEQQVRQPMLNSHGFSLMRAVRWAHKTGGQGQLTAQITKKMMLRMAQRRSLSCSAPSVFIAP